MSNLPKTLYAKLAVTFVALFVVIIAGFLWLMLWSSNQYHLEVTQRLNSSLAMYVSGAKPLIQNGEIQEDTIKELAHMVMIVNPGVEVYLLDKEGGILANALPEGSVEINSVDLDPIKSMIDGESVFPSLGKDPRNPNTEKIFSAFTVTDVSTKEFAGYLYIILAGEAYQNLSESLRSSHILRNSFAIIVLATLFACICGFVLFSTITKPLRLLTVRMLKFQEDELGDSISNLPTTQDNHDEIAQLNQVFGAMSELIHEQIERLGEIDRVRRELISNVSHDLRTPIASMQGYLETLMIKQDKLSPLQREEYTAIAHKHGQHLTRLVGELFELSKLESGRVHPKKEAFSLAELCQDISHKFKLKLENKNINLAINTKNNHQWVIADIALIERVLENLIENAIRYTPVNGEIELLLTDSEESVTVSVKDNGCGVSPEDLTKIFDRYYQTNQQAIQKTSQLPSVAPSTNDTHKDGGLGLAIVKKILELHNSHISVCSQVNEGTEFSFPLPFTAA